MSLKLDIYPVLEIINKKLDLKVREKMKIMYDDAINPSKSDQDYRKEVANLKKADEIIRSIIKEIEKENN